MGGPNRTIAPLTAAARLAGGVAARSCHQDAAEKLEMSVAGRGLGGEMAGKKRDAKTSSRSLPSLIKAAPDATPTSAARTTPPFISALVPTAPLRPDQPLTSSKVSQGGRLRKGTITSSRGGKYIRKPNTRVSCNCYTLVERLSSVWGLISALLSFLWRFNVCIGDVEISCQTSKL